MATTDNLNLYITDDSSESFQTFRRKVAGTGNDSNMVILDSAISAMQPVAMSFTLAASSWGSVESGRYDLTDQRFLIGNYAYIVQPAATSVTNWRECGVWATQANTAGTFYFFYDYSMPTTNISVNILRVAVAT